MRLIPLVISLLPFASAHAAPVPDDGDPLDPGGGPAWVITPDGDGHLPDDLYIAGRKVIDITVHRRGALIIDDDGSVDLDGPGSLASLAAGGIIAPFWATLEADACPGAGAPAGRVLRANTATGVRFAWHGIPVEGCPEGGGDTATFSVELFLDDGHLTMIELRYGALPAETLALEPRAGYRVAREDDSAVAFELLPDPADGVQRGRAKLLAEGSSDGEPGVWVIELDAEGRLVGDPDADGRRAIDNCEDDFNPLQEDLDGDGRGDACALDIDGDGIRNGDDNCPRVSSRDLGDLDGDGQGDVCDPDEDGDGLVDGLDLCPRRVDPSNHDLDGDGRGDVCDGDADGDDWLAGRWGRWQPERCPLVFDPWRGDVDGDGLGDSCDLEPYIACRGDCADQRDTDGDRIADAVDRCPWVADQQQRDGDGDGLGDACDADRNDDGVLDVYQLCALGGCDPIAPIGRFGRPSWP